MINEKNVQKIKVYHFILKSGFTLIRTLSAFHHFIKSQQILIFISLGPLIIPLLLIWILENFEH